MLKRMDFKFSERRGISRFPGRSLPPGTSILYLHRAIGDLSEVEIST